MPMSFPLMLTLKVVKKKIQRKWILVPVKWLYLGVFHKLLFLVKIQKKDCIGMEKILLVSSVYTFSPLNFVLLSLLPTLLAFQLELISGA